MRGSLRRLRPRGPLGHLVFNHLRRMRGRFFLASLSTATIIATEILGPWPLKIIVDYILLDTPLPDRLSFLRPVLERSELGALALVASSILAIALVRAAASYWQVYLTSEIGSRLVHALRRELFAHLQRLSLSFHSRARSGELMTKLASDTTRLRSLFADFVLIIATELATLAAMIAVMFALQWKLALIILAIFPALVVSFFILYRKATVSARRQRRQEERIATRISEALATVPLIKAFGRERYERERFDSESEEYLALSIRNARIEAATLRSVEVIGAVGTAAVVLCAAWLALQGEMVVGSILVFISYLKGFFRPVRHLAKLSAKSSAAMVSMERLAEILAVEPETRDRPDAVRARGLAGSIVFEDVWFDYGDGVSALKGVSFSVSPGQHVALVGPSGAGKSTLISLILRLYDPQQGRILIDGIETCDYRRDSLRQEIGIVLQEAHLFGASIRENIAYGKLDATLAEIVEAATAAGAHDFIVSIPDGYETVMGERGQTLSKGQRQRIAIARALIRRPSILILDEPMTGLDSESQAQVVAAVARLGRGRTCITITHDLRTVVDADLVVMLEAGRVVERGSHVELMDRSGRYRRLHKAGAMTDGPPVLPLRKP
jgi:ATP-binding cassette subfamily B protein